MKKDFVDVFKDLLDDDRMVRLSDVAEMFVATLSMLDEKSGNFAKVKEATPKGYTGMMNTILLSMLSNLSILGMDEDGAKAFQESIEDKNVVSMTLEIIKGDER